MNNKMPYFKYKNKSCYYEEIGSGKPLIFLHGDDWESIVDNDTIVTLEHNKNIGKFFHKPLNELKANILMTGSKEDDVIGCNNKNFLEDTYKAINEKVLNGEYYIFENGGHLAMISNLEKFIEISKNFLSK